MSMNGWTRRDMLNGLVLGAAAAATGKAAEVKVYNTSPNKTDADIAKMLADSDGETILFCTQKNGVLRGLNKIPANREIEPSIFSDGETSITQTYYKCQKTAEGTKIKAEIEFEIVGRNKGKETAVQHFDMSDPSIKVVNIVGSKIYARVNPNSWSEIPV